MGQKLLSALKLWVPLLALGSFSSIFGASVLPSCGTDTLANYTSQTAFPPVTGGCMIGILDYYNFTYTAVTNAPSSSAIKVTPSGSGFSFSGISGPITAAAGQTVKFEIDYQIIIDPAPILTGGDLGLDPPTGSVTITEYFCNDIPYIYTGTCLGGSTPDTLQVGTPPTGLPSSATIVFPDPATKSQQVGIVFTLVGGTTGASFDNLSAQSTIVVLASGTPEPASAASLLLGLLALGGGYKLRKRSTKQ